MDNYAPNSHRYKEEQKQAAEKKEIKKVISGTAKPKSNELRKFTSIFISEDVKNVKEYILLDVLVPTIKKTILGAIDMMLNGGSSSYSGRSSSSKVSYRKYYDEPRDERRSNGNTVRTRFDYDDIGFPSRGEAEAVREEMCNVIERYGFVTVADMYDMAGLSQPFTSNKYGWTNIRNAEVVRSGGEYVIKLPKALPID